MIALERKGFSLRVERFDVVPGEIHAILGASGSGKSTLVRALAGLEPRADLATIRRGGLVQQKPGLLRASVRANVEFPLVVRGVARSERRRVAEDWLARLGLAQKADALATTLSGGEAQRVALARALAPKPDVLFLDEATNQLDPRGVRRVEEILMEEAASGAALVLVTHSVAQARRLASRVTFLDAGRVVRQGPTREVLSSPDEAIRAFVEFA